MVCTACLPPLPSSCGIARGRLRLRGAGVPLAQLSLCTHAVTLSLRLIPSWPPTLPLQVRARVWGGAPPRAQGRAAARRARWERHGPGSGRGPPPRAPARRPGAGAGRGGAGAGEGTRGAALLALRALRLLASGLGGRGSAAETAAPLPRAAALLGAPPHSATPAAATESDALQRNRTQTEKGASTPPGCSSS